MLQIVGYKCKLCDFESTKRGWRIAMIEIEDHLKYIHGGEIKIMKEKLPLKLIKLGVAEKKSNKYKRATDDWVRLCVSCHHYFDMTGNKAWKSINASRLFKNNLEEKLDNLFPKGKCKERGAALVLFAYAVILFKKYSKEI